VSTILLRGPFTDNDIAKIVAVMSGIEATRPDEVFEVHVDDPESHTAMEEFLEKISPLRAGYERVLRYRHVKPRGKE